MCDFGIISGPMIMMGVSAATAAAGAAASIHGQSQQRSAAQQMEQRKKSAQEDLMAENRRRATKDYLTQVSAETLQQRQEQEGVAEKGSDIARQTIKTQATGIASAAERGVSGRTIDMVVSDYDMQADLEIGRIKENQKLANIQHTQRKTGYETEFDNRVSAAKPYTPKPIAPVDYFGPIFGAVGQTLNTGVQTGLIGGGKGKGSITSQEA